MGSISTNRVTELRVLTPYIARIEEQRLVQFLVALRDDLESLRGNIVHRTSFPLVHSMVSKLLTEDIPLKSHIGMGVIPTPSVLAMPHRTSSIPFVRSNARVADDGCSFCKQPGHWKAQCPKLMNRSMQLRSHHPRQFQPS